MYLGRASSAAGDLKTDLRARPNYSFISTDNKTLKLCKCLVKSWVIQETRAYLIQISLSVTFAQRMRTEHITASNLLQRIGAPWCLVLPKTPTVISNLAVRRFLWFLVKSDASPTTPNPFYDFEESSDECSKRIVKTRIMCGCRNFPYLKCQRRNAWKKKFFLCVRTAET